MNITLSPEQFLTVYNAVITNPSLEAQEVKNKMDSVIIEALSTIDDSQNHSKFSHWIKKEKEKVVAMEVELKSIKDTPTISTQPFDDGLFPLPVKS